MFIVPKRLPTRKIFSPSSDTLQKNCPRNDKKRGKANISEERASGWVMFVPFPLLFHDLSKLMLFQRHSLVLGNDIPPVPDFLAHLVDKADMGSSAKEKAERDARWIGDFTDELTVSIALRQWDQAARLVEEGMRYRLIDHIIDSN